MLRRLSAGSLVAALCASPGVLAQEATPAWRSGFEQGFPGEWLDFDEGAYTASGTPNNGQTAAWTIVSREDDPVVMFGDHAYKGWPISRNSDSQRAYPVFAGDVPSPLVNSFMVYLDVNYDDLSTSEWIQLATWSNNADWYVHTMSVRARRLEMAHLDWSYIGPTPQPEFPVREWVRFTAYIHYDGAEGYIRVWQDGVPVMEGNYTERSGRSLINAHWGWYSEGTVVDGVQYNDEVQIWTLDAPLTELDTEPPSPYDSDPGGTGGTGGSSGNGGTGNDTGGSGGRGNGGSSQGGASGGEGGSSAGTGPGGRGGNTGGTSSGGASSGGSATTGGSPSAGGSAGSGGVIGGGSGAPPESLNQSEDEAGCGCRTAGTERGRGSLLALALGSLLLFRRRSRA